MQTTNKLKVPLTTIVTLLVKEKLCVGSQNTFGTCCQNHFQNLCEGVVPRTFVVKQTPEELLQFIKKLLRQKKLRANLSTYLSTKEHKKLFEFYSSRVDDNQFYFFVKLSKIQFNAWVSWIVDKYPQEHTVTFCLKQKNNLNVTFKATPGNIRMSQLILMMLCCNGFKLQALAYFLEVSVNFLKKYVNIGLAIAEKDINSYFLSPNYWTPSKLREYPPVYNSFFEKYVF